MSNVTNFPNEMEDMIRNLKRHLPQMIESQIIFAEIQRAKYDACIQQGFSEKEALELCKNITV